MAAFGQRVGKLAALFPVMYLSGGSCVMLIITGGRTMQLFFNTICPQHSCHAHPISALLCFLVFTSMAILISQLTPTLNSVAGVSLVGAITAITYCTLYWALSLSNGRPPSVSYTPSLSHPGHDHSSTVSNLFRIINSIGIIALSFRGHNVMLEIQGTLPSSPEKPSKELMGKGVIMSYAVIGMCVFPVAIAGFWAYGNQIPADGGMMRAFEKFHGHEVELMGLLYLLITIHCLSSFQVYAMPVFDNLELRYIKAKKKRCSRLLRSCFRLMFGALTLFIAVTFPFLPKLAALLGGITLVPVTYAYPCFMWMAIKKPPKGGPFWCFNLVLGCLGILLSLLLVASSTWTLVCYGLHATFFKP